MTSALLKEQVLDDEGLATLMCKVESIVNGRPLTKVSDDPRDPEALTPNHLLLLRSGPEMPPGVFRKGDLYSRRRWRQVQYLSDVFWRRWKGVSSLFARETEVATIDEQLRNWRHRTRGRRKLPKEFVAPRAYLEVKPNKGDGLVRRVSLKTKTAVLERPIDKIVQQKS